VAKALSELEKPLFRFGGFELDPHERRLSAQGRPVTLTPKVFDTLVLLVERAGHVVSKDELMQALWPRGFVDESNLTKHIWLIRKALDDGGDTCIETVPKHGYRFTAAVERVTHEAIVSAVGGTADIAASAADAAASESAVAAAQTDIAQTAAMTPAPPARAQRRRWGWIAAGIFASLAIVAAAEWLQHPALEHVAPQSGSVAIIDFGNLSQNARDAWLAPALTQMLATELAADGAVHALPDELVRPAHADLPATAAGGYAPRSLDKLRERVGADYVLSGSYLVSGDAAQPDLRVDFTLQDARDSHTIASLARSAPVADLPALIAQAGGELRGKLGVTNPSREQLQQIAAAQPPSAEVARRIGIALNAMRRDDAARARDELLDAVSQAPNYAPSYSHLAQAWSALGYQAKALAAAQQAAAHAAGLPEEQRLQIDVQVQLATHDWDKAVGALRSLVALRPANPEYRYQLVTTLIDAGKPGDAQTELAPLLASRDANPDPRLELMQSLVASARDDDQQAAAHAARALELARTLELPGVAAEAGVRLGIARNDLGDLAGAEQALRQARADYAKVGNPHGEAWVDQNLGNAWMQSDPTRARESYQRALAGYQVIGDRGGEAGAYSDLGIMLWAGGDRDGAEAATRKVLALRRETADLSGQAWALAALGTILADESASDEVEQDYREAIALDERSAARSHRAFTLGLYADDLRLRGDLAEAARLCQQAIDGFRDVDNDGGVASMQFECALIALDRGDLAATRSGIDQAAAGARKFKDATLAFNVDLTRGQIALADGDLQGASASLERAAATAGAAQFVAAEAIAQGLYALCSQQRGDNAARDRAKSRAVELRSRINQRQEVFMVDIALAQLDALGASPADGIAKLQALAADADRRHWLAWSLEARLAEVQSLAASGDAHAAEALRAVLEADAKARGFGWIVARLARVPAAAPEPRHAALAEPVSQRGTTRPNAAATIRA
jgi:DNA-binding winged helix-turn-helix (wHTH) protein/tetratricopeptide (TPR) repeat protein/TolB-like protein